MSKENINIVYVDINELKFAEYNPRKANKEQIEQVKKSLQKFGFVDPVIVNSAENRKNTIIGGHLRVKVAKDIGIKQVPVVYVNIPDIEKEKELNLRLNKNTGDWDFDILANFDIDLLKDVGFDLKDLDIDLDIIEKIDKGQKVKTIELNEDLINFPSTNKYGIPDLIPDLIYDGVIDDVKTVINSKSLEEKANFYLINYNKISFSKTETKNILSFYCYDYEFETVWRDTAKFVKKIEKYNFETIISPNWSLFPKDPIALQIWNTFKSRYIARYLQELGYRIIPDLNFSTYESLDITLLGLPKELPYISLQCQNLLPSDYENWYRCFERIIKELSPKRILLYGGEKIKNIIKKNVLERCIILSSINEEIRNVKNKNKID